MRRGDLRACQRLLWEGSKSFAAASLLLPGRVRRPATAVYAFCRVADDMVDTDDAGTDALRELDDRLDAAYAGRPWNVPVDRAFAEVIERFEIPRAVPEALFEGFAWDIEQRRYRELADLEQYCARVAATVGVMMTLLMGRRDPETLARACDLGVAMQLTNIARDVGEDAAAGRIYLPIRWLEEHRIDPEQLLLHPTFSPPLGAVVKRLLEVAEQRYRRADLGVARLPLDCRPAIASARAIYSAIGAEISRAGYDSVTVRAHTSRAQKLGLIAGALAGLLRPSLARPYPPGAESEFLLAATAR